MDESTVESTAGVFVDLTEKMPIRVLHVDSDPGFLKVAKLCLELQGQFKVDTAFSIEDAIEKMKKKSYDVIISDYVMPEKSGLEFLKELRDSGNKIPFIMFTGKGREEVAIKALNLGADQYFNKIGDPETVYGELAHGIRQVMERKRAEEALKESKNYLETILDSIFSGVVVIDAETHKIVDANTKALETIGVSKEHIIGKVCHIFICPAEKGKCPIIDLGQSLEKSESVLLRADGKKIPILKTVTAMMWKGHKYLIESLIDIAEQKQAEKALQKSEEGFRTLMEEAPIGICNTDLMGKITYANKKFEEATGYSREEIVGKNSFKLGIMSDETLKLLAERMKKRLIGKPSRLLEGRFKRKDGEWIWAEIEGRLIKKFGVPVGFQLTARDITERKRTEKAIRESQEKFEQLFMSNPEAAVYADSDFHVLDANSRFSELFGYSLDEIKGKQISDLIVPEDKKEEGQTLDNEAKKTFVYYDTVRKKKDGTLVPVSISAASITIEGQPVGYVGMYKDITERKHFEERLSTLHTYSRDLNIAESREEIYRLTLDAMEKTLGFEIAFFMIVNKDMLCVADHRGYPEAFSIKLPLDGTKRGVSVKVAQTGRSINVPDAEKEDTWVEFMPGIRSALDVPVKIGSKVLGVIGVDSKKLNAFNEKDQELLEILASHAATALSNLDRAKNLEAYAKEIRESQEKFERLFMNNPEAADYLDPTFHIIDVNPRFIELFGYSLDEVKGKHINDVIVPKGKMEEAKMLDEEAEKTFTYHDTVRRRKDGSLVPVSISAAPIIVEGNLIGSVGLYKDISDLKKAEGELKATLNKLELMNEKLRVVGGLTRHDVRNKLSAITMNIYLAKSRLAMDDKALERLNEIEPIVRNVERIFDFARTYEMIGIEELVYIDVNKTFEEAVSLFSDLKGVEIVNNCSGLTVLADSLLRQFFYNLIDNSLKYGEKITQIRIYFEKTEDDKLKLIYEDDGVGIPEKMRSNLFKEGVGKGTGYGLYMIKKICETYGWTIQETGKPRKGVQFIITMPKMSEDGEENYRIP